MAEASRIARKPIEIKDVKVEIGEDQLVKVTGKLGTLTHQCKVVKVVRANEEGNEVLKVEWNPLDQKSRAIAGTTRQVISNMVHGVTVGFVQGLEIVGVGYRAKAAGKDLELSLGKSHPEFVTAPENISFKVLSPTEVEVHGIDKQLVGQVAAEIRSLRPPENYKGKGIRYKGEVIIIKETKKK